MEKHKLVSAIRQLARIAIEEDLGAGDITADLIEPGTRAQATVISREPAVIAGTAWFDEVFHQLDPQVKINWRVADGEEVEADAVLCELQGPARALLSGERTALNLLQTLSATATATRQYVKRVAHTRCRILDTRKTIPGLRIAQKFAVQCGGGENHRLGLYDKILIKENHILAAGSITRAVDNARRLHPNVPIEVEVENLAELQEAIDCQVDTALLDNMNNELLRQAVAINQGKIKLEASGGITLENIAGIAETGVDYISTGDITKNIKAIDLSMRFQE